MLNIWSPVAPTEALCLKLHSLSSEMLCQSMFPPGEPTKAAEPPVLNPPLLRRATAPGTSPAPTPPATQHRRAARPRCPARSAAAGRWAATGRAYLMKSLLSVREFCRQSSHLFGSSPGLSCQMRPDMARYGRNCRQVMDDRQALTGENRCCLSIYPLPAWLLCQSSIA
jgi:hypothetical protein